MGESFYLLFVAAAFIASCSQIILKTAATKNYESRLAEYLNKRVMLAYSLFGLSALMSMFALRHIPLSMAVILESTGYVFVAGLSWILLGERLNKTQLLGIVMIVLGIAIFSFV